MKPVDAFKTYRAMYPTRAMRIPAKNADELIQMQTADGRKDLPEAPLDKRTLIGSAGLPNSRGNAPQARHLWVIESAAVPYALEACAWGAGLESGVIKHSNLTGGGVAHSGGEIWFVDERSIIVNANSGRYGAQSEKEFELVVAAFLDCGYNVASMGFDIDNPTMPNSILIGEPEWRKPAQES
jgi:hypothetical protein